MPRLTCLVNHYYSFSNVPDYLLSQDSPFNDFNEQIVGSWYMTWGTLHYWDKNGDEIVVEGEDYYCSKTGTDFELDSGEIKMRDCPIDDEEENSDEETK
jgi:hypothetical protein